MKVIRLYDIREDEYYLTGAFSHKWAIFRSARKFIPRWLWKKIPTFP